MISSSGGCPFQSRRGFLGAAGGLAIAGSGAARDREAASGIRHEGIEPFQGAHQAGIATPPQGHLYFAAFDLHAGTPGQVARLLRLWTETAARMTSGLPPEGEDSDETLGLPPSQLTVTFGFGPGLFVFQGKDRYGLAAKRPEALVDLPAFAGDQALEPARCGGDLSVQACADDPQVAFHAVRRMARVAQDAAHLRWTQVGFNASFASGQTARNLMGFKDGTQNPVPGPHRVRAASQPAEGEFDQVVWVGGEGPAWMQGGSYQVVRRIRIALEHWDNTPVDVQEQTIGRRKISGAPLGATREFDPADLNAVDADGNAVIPDNAHLRMAAPQSNGGARVLRRAFSYNEGANVIAERWPPWRQGLEYDAGLFFIAYQRDPRTGFIKIFHRMATLDALNQFTTHCGSGIFACPGGVEKGAFIGQGLFES